MTVTLAPQQVEAFETARRWMRESQTGEKVFVLTGCAGTGKTTIAKYIADNIVGDPEATAFAAFTGKAAQQLRLKGCDRATTLHKLLYAPIDKDRSALIDLVTRLQEALKTDPKSERRDTTELQREVAAERKRIATPSWENFPRVPPGTRLIVVDECSMVDNKIYQDLVALGIPILFLGDPFQLPPVFGKSPVDERQPDFHLTDVHRQALENPVLAAATAIRTGQAPVAGENSSGRFTLLDPAKASYEDYARHDQVLCGKNKTRGELNRRMRRRLVKSGELERTTLALAANDRVVFLRNDHDESVYNGTTATVKSVVADTEEEGLLLLDCDDDYGEKLVDVYPVWPGVLEDLHISEAPRWTQVVDLAYALTVHKAQGSEWNSVLVHHEPFGSLEERRRWLYTAVTRARRDCTLVTRSA